MLEIISYKTSSERHLKTAKYLEGVYNGLPESGNILDKSHLLLNMYYLTGYVIETIVNYGILKLIDFDNIRKKNPEIRRVEDLTPFTNNYNVGFRYEIERDKPITRLKHTEYPLYAKGHQISDKKLKFFTNQFKLTDLGIRGIDRDISNLKVQKLLNKWKAEVRYEFKDMDLINYENVHNFILLAEEIHNGIKFKITKD
jgi:hypothetical protein